MTSPQPHPHVTDRPSVGTRAGVLATEPRTAAAEPTMPRPSHSRTHTVVARAANGQARTYRLSRPASRQTAYRRLALAILHLDVATLADELHSARKLVLPRAA